MEQLAAPTSRREARARHRGRRRRGGSRGAALAAAPLALLASGALVYQASNAAFTGTTTSTAAFAAGTVTLTNSAGVAFNVSGLKPGDTATQCIDVTYTGSLPSTVKLYLTSFASTGAAAPNSLADFLQIMVQESATTCAANTGYSYIAGSSSTSGVSLFSLKTSATSFSSGAIGSWTNATTNAVHSYKVTYWLPEYGAGGSNPAFGAAGAPASQSVFDGVQGATTGATLTWEARNN